MNPQLGVLLLPVLLNELTACVYAIVKLIIDSNVCTSELPQPLRDIRQATII